MHESRHIIAAAVVGVGIGLAGYMTGKLIQYTLKNTTNGADANAINISSRTLEVCTEILNYLRFPSACRSINEQKPESMSQLKIE
jgi:hypothetical protein